MKWQIVPVMVLALLSGLGAVPGGAGADALVIGGTVHWIAANPAGTAARVRVRGAALAELTSAGDNWHLTCGGTEIAAVLSTPQWSVAEEFPLELAWQTEPVEADLTAVVDRGEVPAELTHLRVYFAAPAVLGVLRLEASDDDHTYTPAGGPQVVCQRLGNGVLRLTDIPVAAGDLRFIKLHLADSGGVQLDKITGWSIPEQAAPMYEVNATLGQMRDGTIDGEHLWPLLLEQNAAPLAKLKVLADAPGTLRRMRVVRLSPEGHPTGNVASAVWADTLTTAGATPLTRSEKWIELPATDSSGDGWAIIVEDGDDPALQLNGVVAYAAEVELYFTLPADPQPVELWLEPGEVPRLDLATLKSPPDRPTGEIAELDLARGVSIANQRPSAPQWQTELQVVWGNWGKVALYVLGALVALILALTLLKPRTPDGEAG